MNARELTHIWLEVPLFDKTLALLPAGVSILRQDTAQPVYRNAAPAQAIVASSLIQYSSTLMDACPKLRLIARTGIGVDNIDLAAATERGIVVTNTPDGPTESTAEHTVAMLLSLAKRIKQGGEIVAAGQWGPRQGVLLGDEVWGKTLGLIGLGRIGRRVAQICRLAFSMRVVAHDPFVTAEQAAALDIELASLATVIAEAHFVSLHVPATPETYRLMHRERIDAMRPGAYLLNLARGPLVDEQALLDALDRGHLAGAGLDVFDPEPLPIPSRLRNHPNVIATPHMASNTWESRSRMETMAIERVLAFFRGEWPADVVNPDARRD